MQWHVHCRRIHNIMCVRKSAYLPCPETHSHQRTYSIIHTCSNKSAYVPCCKVPMHTNRCICTYTHILLYTQKHTYTHLQPKEEWMERRTLRRDRQDLHDLQLSLQSEIDAKSKIAKDLRDLKAQYGEMER